MKIAYMTLATTPEFLRGASVLYETYKDTHSKYPFYVLVWPETNIAGFEYLPIKPIEKIQKQTNIVKEYSIDIFSKFAIYTMFDFDYILFIDADAIFKNNLDSYLEELIEANPTKEFFNFNYNESKKRIFGDFFMVRPNQEIYNWLIANINKYQYEGYLLYEYYYSVNPEIRLDLQNALYPYTHHFGGRIGKEQKKYWDLPLYDFIQEKLIYNEGED